MSTQVNVGDELAVGNRWYPFSIHRVTKISPKGFITMSNGDVLNQDLSIRGLGRDSYSIRPREYEPVTTIIVEAMDRAMFLERVGRRYWESLTTDQLRRIVAILDEGKS